MPRTTTPRKRDDIMMNSSTDKCRIAVLAGMLLQVINDMQRLGIEELTLDGILQATGVSRSQAYAWAARVRDWRESQVGPGRPKDQETPKESEKAPQELVSDQVRDWLMAHPGAVCTGPKRNTYSDAFRSFVLDLMAPGGPLADYTQAQAAERAGVPLHTLHSWLAAGKQVTDSPVDGEEESADKPTEEIDEQAGENDESELPTSQWAVKAAQVIELWKKWRGPFGRFCRSLKDHGIRMSPAMVRTVLSVSGERKWRRRRGSNPDAEAIRGELLRMFPNAQWNADGKNVLVRVGDDLIRFTMELVVDTATAAHLGFSLRKNEDSEGLLGAMDQATASTGEPPIGFVRDPRKCNLADAVETKLREDGVISMLTSVKRPQSNAPAENAFSLFGHKLPIPCLPDPEKLTPVELGRLVMSYMLLGVCVGRNHTPRLRLKGKTPAEAFAESQPTEEDKARAREELKRLKRQIEEQSRANRRRCMPDTLKMVRQAIIDLGLSDPDDRYAPAIAKYGLEAALEAIAVFRAKKEADTLPERNHERYLLGIARNVCYRIEDLRVYESLLELRTRAGELIRSPLDQHDKRLSRLADDAYIKEVLDMSLKSEALVDRTYWRQRLLAALEHLEQTMRFELGKHCARKVAARRSISPKERNSYIAELATCIVPIAA
jgi:transposase InsO family protein